MKKILAFNGSPRKNGNTSSLLNKFREGTFLNAAIYEEINPHFINIEYCTGCLRCNLIKRCSISTDDWTDISRKILEADVLVFGSPIYFHHLTAALKKIVDRFRSFVKVQITETGLNHTPHQLWNKDFVIILSMGSSDNIDSKPVIELFEYITSIMGIENRFHIIQATRLGIVKQIEKSENELEILYGKMELSTSLAKIDYLKNYELLMKCYELGKQLSL